MPPNATASDVGVTSRGKVRRTVPLETSSSSRALSVESATHRRPRPKARLAAFAPPRLSVCVTRSIEGSIRLTVPPRVADTQIDPAPAVKLASPGTGMRSTTPPPRAGSIRHTSSSSASVTHNDPASATIAPGVWPSPIDRVVPGPIAKTRFEAPRTASGDPPRVRRTMPTARAAAAIVAMAIGTDRRRRNLPRVVLGGARAGS